MLLPAKYGSGVKLNRSCAGGRVVGCKLTGDVVPIGVGEEEVEVETTASAAPEGECIDGGARASFAKNAIDGDGR